MIAAARWSLVTALHQSLPGFTELEIEAIADEAIDAWERDGWFATPERPPVARRASRRTPVASDPCTAATEAA